LTTSLSSIIDDCQGKIKRFSLGKRIVEDKKDVANGKNTAIISNSLMTMMKTPITAKKLKVISKTVFVVLLPFLFLLCGQNKVRSQIYKVRSK